MRMMHTSAVSTGSRGGGSPVGGGGGRAGSGVGLPEVALLCPLDCALVVESGNLVVQLCRVHPLTIVVSRRSRGCGADPTGGGCGGSTVACCSCRGGASPSRCCCTGLEQGALCIQNIPPTDVMSHTIMLMQPMRLNTDNHVLRIAHIYLALRHHRPSAKGVDWTAGGH